MLGFFAPVDVYFGFVHGFREVGARALQRTSASFGVQAGLLVAVLRFFISTETKMTWPSGLDNCHAEDYPAMVLDVRHVSRLERVGERPSRAPEAAGALHVRRAFSSSFSWWGSEGLVAVNRPAEFGHCVRLHCLAADLKM